MTNFYSDLNQEGILSKYLDNIYQEKGIDFYRVFDLDRQHQGIDVVMIIRSDEYLIDEKAQLHYINRDLPTFTFELSYLKGDDIREGWLFDKSKLTDYYFLITGIYLKEGKAKLLIHTDIEKLKITSVKRSKLIELLSSRSLNRGKLMNYESKIRENCSYGKNFIEELNPNYEGLIYFTEHLIEKPINIQLRLSFLINSHVAKKFHYV